MFKKFDVTREIFDNLPHGFTEFELILNGKEYAGQYRNGEVNWYHPQPNPDHHNMNELEAEVHKILVKKYIH